MQLSIVIPVYNPVHLESKIQEFLVPQLESFKRNSRLGGVEWIYVCNGCTEKTRQVLNDYQDTLPLKVLWFDEGLGFTKATNEGIKASKGDIILMWNDDAVLLDYLDSQNPCGATKDTWKNILLKPFTQNEKIGLVGTHELWCDNSKSWFFVGYCVALRRVMLESIGLLDEIFSPGSGEDIDMSIRARLYGWQTYNADPVRHEMVYRGRELRMNEHTFPIWHAGESTFHHWDAKNDFNENSRWAKVFNKNGETLKSRRLSGYYSQTSYLEPTVPKLGVAKKNIHDCFLVNTIQ